MRRKTIDGVILDSIFRKAPQDHLRLLYFRRQKMMTMPPNISLLRCANLKVEAANRAINRHQFKIRRTHTKPFQRRQWFSMTMDPERRVRNRKSRQLEIDYPLEMSTAQIRRAALTGTLCDQEPLALKAVSRRLLPGARIKAFDHKERSWRQFADVILATIPACQLSQAATLHQMHNLVCLERLLRQLSWSQPCDRLFLAATPVMQSELPPHHCQ